VRTVWLDGSLVGADAAIDIADPAVRWGLGLFETMRAEHGRVRFLARHLDRLERSSRALELAVADRRSIERAVRDTVDACGVEHQRVRVTVGPTGLLLVESTPVGAPPDTPGTRAAALVPDTWFPERAFAEHKTLSYASYRVARASAEARGADLALLADGRGRLGEADNANLVAVLDGELVTPPVRGLLPGVARGALLEAGLLREGDLDPEIQGRAEALLALNAVDGFACLRDVDGAPWSREAAPPVAVRAHTQWLRLGSG
jgi:branched-chain amino acid aminotransferase